VRTNAGGVRVEVLHTDDMGVDGYQEQTDECHKQPYICQGMVRREGITSDLCRLTEIKMRSAPSDSLQDANEYGQAYHNHQSEGLDVVEDEQLIMEISLQQAAEEGSERGEFTERVCLLKPNLCSITKVE